MVVFVDRFSKMVHIAPMKQQRHGAEETAESFINNVFRLHGLPEKIISDRGSQFVSVFFLESNAYSWDGGSIIHSYASSDRWAIRKGHQDDKTNATGILQRKA